MGRELPQRDFTDEDTARFAARLRASLGLLDELLSSPGFGGGERTIGAEMEMFLVTPDGVPVPRNEEVRAVAADSRLVLEVNRYNLEANLTPVPLRSRPFTALHDEAAALLDIVREAGARYGAEPYCAGLLPTLRPGDLTRRNVSSRKRYALLDDALGRAGRGLRVTGEQRCRMRSDTICSQGAASSWQVHLTVRPEEFTRFHNAAQLMTAPVLAVGANSPLLLGRRVWDETRIPWYEQAFGQHRRRFAPADRRSGFGHNWLRGGVRELIEESVTRYAPLMPFNSDGPWDRPARPGGPPALEELRLHLGTLWWWNRLVYDPAGAGHLRIELRALPAGPTPADMAANTALLTGLVLDRAAREPGGELPFALARENFYTAARDGMAARLWWPSGSSAPVRVAARDLVMALLPRAAAGLAGAGVADSEVQRWLGVVEARVLAGRSGAHWQRRTHRALGSDTAMARRYLKLSATGAPVHSWPAPRPSVRPNAKVRTVA
ncbi:glutamate--cysteine ligase [Streptomyces sp. IBSBF 2435]|uniref:glutamate--cysteine ligase n=1 Tax=Streptomyces sp. IBSBF 2435 TaxID=2903531 RepID=UPI002FDBC83F